MVNMNHLSICSFFESHQYDLTGKKPYLESRVWALVNILEGGRLSFREPS